MSTAQLTILSELYAENVISFTPVGFLGRLKINVMQGDSIDHSLQRNRLLQRAGSQLISLSVPEIAGIKIAPFRKHGCSISTIILPFKILFQYRLVNTDIVNPPDSILDTKQY